MTIVLAHQGGWDEILMVAVPIAVFALLLYIANNRASHLGDQAAPEGDENATGDKADKVHDKIANKGHGGAAGTHVPPPSNPRRGPI